MKYWLFALAVVAVVAIAAAGFLLRPIEGPARDLTLVGDAGRGAYLIRLGDCVTCHTDKKAGVAELGGGPALKSPFGTFYAPNITPDPEAGIGNWTLTQFAKAMSDGEGPQGELYPAFPYQHYTLMSDQEIADLFAALKQVPPASTPSKPHDVPFPFNLRFGLAAWKTLFFEPQRFEPDPSQSKQWNRGKYLVEGPGHCVMCHSPRNLLGGIEQGKELSGNPAGGTGGRAPALTAAALEQEGYDESSIASALSDGFTPEFDVLGGPMGEVIEDGTSHWTDEDRLAVARYLMADKRSTVAQTQ